jgi:hypothetical protein
MKAIVEILQEAGQLEPGFHIHIDNEPWMTLDIEEIQQAGPNGLPTLSLAHYGSQNGDLMRDPEMLFEMEGTGSELKLWPYYWRNDYLGIEQYSSYRNEAGRLIVNISMRQQHRMFAAMWSRNLRAQGFIEAYRRQLKGL